MGFIHDDDHFFTQTLVALWEGYIPQTYFNGVWSAPGLPRFLPLASPASALCHGRFFMIASRSSAKIFFSC
jgi:hypothetical protein